MRPTTITEGGFAHTPDLLCSTSLHTSSTTTGRLSGNRRRFKWTSKVSTVEKEETRRQKDGDLPQNTRTVPNESGPGGSPPSSTPEVHVGARRLLSQVPTAGRRSRDSLVATPQRTQKSLLGVVLARSSGCRYWTTTYVRTNRKEEGKEGGRVKGLIGGRVVRR